MSRTRRTSQAEAALQNEIERINVAVRRLYSEASIAKAQAAALAQMREEIESTIAALRAKPPRTKGPSAK